MKSAYLTIALLVGASCASAQTCTVSTAYSASETMGMKIISYTADPNGGDPTVSIHPVQSVIVSGSAKMISPTCPAAFHTPSITNKLSAYGNTYGGTQSGATVCQNCYSFQEFDLEVPLVNFDDPFTQDPSIAQVLCTVKGVFFLANFSQGGTGAQDVHIAYLRSIWAATGQDPVSVTNFCELLVLIGQGQGPCYNNATSPLTVYLWPADNSWCVQTPLIDGNPKVYPNADVYHSPGIGWPYPIELINGTYTGANQPGTPGQYYRGRFLDIFEEVWSLTNHSPWAVLREDTTNGPRTGNIIATYAGITQKKVGSSFPNPPVARTCTYTP